MVTFFSHVLCLHDVFLAFPVAAKQSWIMRFFRLRMVWELESREYQSLLEFGYFKVGLTLPACVIDSKAFLPETLCA